LAAVAVFSLALFHPFYFYPDVETHARFAAAIRQAPALAWDPTPFQLREGTWTREIAGAQVAFPYSPVFHVLSLPFSPFVGDAGAVKLLGIASFGLMLLLVYPFARSLGASPRDAVAAQVLAAVLPVGASRLSLALYPSLLGQLAELGLAVFLIRGRASLGATFGALVLAQLPYVGSLVNVGAFVAILLLLGWIQGEKDARLALAWVASVAVVLALLDRRFLPILFHQILPHLGASPGKEGALPTPIVAGAFGRLSTFFDTLVPVLSLLGSYVLYRRGGRPRVVGGALLLAGVFLLVLKGAAPALFSDVKEVEFLLPILSILAALGIGLLAEKGVPGRALGAALTVGILVIALRSSMEVYATRFVAIGR
jgi:hypothetical protein